MGISDWVLLAAVLVAVAVIGAMVFTGEAPASFPSAFIVRAD
jgi:hypothetical protein